MDNTKSSFLELPAELRLQIYDLAVPNDEYFYRRGYRVPPRTTLPIILASKQLYKEVHPIFYSRNEFCVSITLAPSRHTNEETQFKESIDLLHNSLQTTALRLINNLFVRMAVRRNCDRRACRFYVSLTAEFENGVWSGRAVFNMHDDCCPLRTSLAMRRRIKQEVRRFYRETGEILVKSGEGVVAEDLEEL